VRGKPVRGPLVDEHLIPPELGGSYHLSNRALLYVPCAKAKTRADRKAIARVERIRRRLTRRGASQTEDPLGRLPA
jgi:hypothetical protein